MTYRLYDTSRKRVKPSAAFGTTTAPPRCHTVYRGIFLLSKVRPPSGPHGKIRKSSPPLLACSVLLLLTWNHNLVSSQPKNLGKVIPPFEADEQNISSLKVVWFAWSNENAVAQTLSCQSMLAFQASVTPDTSIGRCIGRVVQEPAGTESCSLSDMRYILQKLRSSA